MTDRDYERHLDRRARKYRRQQHRLELLSMAVQIAADGVREAKRRFWPSFLVAVLLDRDIPPQQRPVQRGEAGA